MPRMFDILKKIAEGEAAPPDLPVSSESTGAAEDGFPRQIWKTVKRASGENAPADSMRTLIESIKKKEVDSIEIASEKYATVRAFLDDLIRKVSLGPCEVTADDLCEEIDLLVHQLFLGDCLLDYATSRRVLDSYLVDHCVNVCVFALAMGFAMNFNKSRLHVLGMAALLHDIGMSAQERLMAEKRPLSREEWDAIRKHPSQSRQMVARLKGDFDQVVESIEQHHERMDGMGYPRGLGRDEICEFARIIGLVDAYDAMTHSRPFKESKLPHYAILEIMNRGKSQFDVDMIKTLVQKLSIYPVGSFVKLNTDEQARVVNANPDSPLRPKVMILLDRFGRHLADPVLMDLSKINFIYIKEPVVLSSPAVNPG